VFETQKLVKRLKDLRLGNFCDIDPLSEPFIRRKGDDPKAIEEYEKQLTSLKVIPFVLPFGRF
jgi:hypothetical protein